MSFLCRALALNLVAVVSLGLGAELPSAEPQEGVLVLRNGRVLQGQITPINDVFLVTQGTSGEVRLPRSEVEFQGRDLDDAYLQRREAMISDDASSHLQLAEWCMRHGLLARAADQILVAFVQDPTNSRLRTLEQRLLAVGVPLNSENRQSEHLAENSIPAVLPKSKLSPQALQQFSTVIQPILFNRCATHACHGNGGTTRFRLIRPALGNAPTSRMTHRNLQVMLSFMDHEHPENSPVLIHGNMAHGGADAPPFADKHRNQLELLEGWVRRTSATPIESIATNSGGPKRVREKTTPKSAVVPAGFDAPDVPNGAPTPAGAVAIPTTLPAARPINATNDSGKRDPFDPEVFNRQYHANGVGTQAPR